MGARYLRTVGAERFGALRDRVVGPFGSGLNVVFGRNEAGKTTLASLIGGVLFGWDAVDGARNGHEPADGSRAGSLVFRARPDGAPSAASAAPAQDGPIRGEDAPADSDLVLARGPGHDAARAAAEVTADVDRDTFRSLFFLTSDELRSLRNTPDVTARLLSAGSGTGASPAQALAVVQERLDACTSRADDARGSLVALTAQRDELRCQLHAAADRMASYRRQDTELRRLEDDRRDMAERVSVANAALEGLSACRAGAEELDAEARSLQAECARLREDEARAAAEEDELARRVGPRLAGLTASEDRVLRDRLDALGSKESRRAHAVDMARGNLSASRAAYEVVLETADDEGERAHDAAARRLRLAMAIAMPLALLLCGLALFVFARSRGSLSYTLVSLVLIGFALIMATSAFVMMLRPDKSADARKERLRDTQWIMLQDQKKLESCLAEQDELADAIRAELEQAGLGAADGSLRRARALLDEARDVRSDCALCRQRRQAAGVRLADATRRLDAIAVQRAHLFERAAAEPDTTLSQIDDLIARKAAQRDSLLEASERLSRHHGELRQLLAQAATDTSFDELKVRYQAVNTRLAQAVDDFERLLLAERLLQAAIATWESRSQPEVYRRASHLLSLMTDGRWTEVSPGPDGQLRVTGPDLPAHDPARLSLGTCQQLYLAMRLALLLTADNVGRSVPILADDILVNFDADRRRGAARALAELAAARQVIVFTCHEEVARALAEADPSACRIDL
ncbi:MAG: AAA family ATPase [Eggerthellaceae bacterium]|nr:AAA family ATPase [Eggerthellaceae bacterium]